jgi:rhodanese-related sulfurtransferase
MNLLRSLFGEPVPTIDARELQEKLAGNPKPYLLDVREPVEFRQRRIAGANLIPLGELNTRLDELPRDREIVCICATGHRSVPAVRQLVDAGYTAVSLRDGMIAWYRARLPVLKGSAG